jgi:glycerol uptake facilitator-like aquaporin
MSNRLLAEVVGTFGFFFIGFSGIAASVNLPGSIAPAGIAAGFGLGLGLMIAAFGQISGGHYNPAVTFGLAIGRKFPTAAVIPYWVAQLIGGFIAAVVASILYTNDIKDSLVTAPGKGVEDWRAMLVELVAVFLFVSVIITVATDDAAPCGDDGPDLGRLVQSGPLDRPRGVRGRVRKPVDLHRRAARRRGTRRPAVDGDPWREGVVGARVGTLSTADTPVRTRSSPPTRR